MKGGFNPYRKSRRKSYIRGRGKKLKTQKKRYGGAKLRTRTKSKKRS